jgi:hypothetical protein
MTELEDILLNMTEASPDIEKEVAQLSALIDECIGDSSFDPSKEQIRRALRAKGFKL